MHSASPAGVCFPSIFLESVHREASFECTARGRIYFNQKAARQIEYLSYIYALSCGNKCRQQNLPANFELSTSTAKMIEKQFVDQVK
jgi:hypothetical protein